MFFAVERDFGEFLISWWLGPLKFIVVWINSPTDS